MTKVDVRALHERIGLAAPVEANRVLALLGVMFTKATEWDLLPDDHPNPVAKVKGNPERSRDRWVTPEEEMPRLLAAIRAEESPFIRAAFLLYLLTGLRRSELLGLRWEWVDLTRRELRLPDTKANRSHMVPLSAPAVELFAELPREFGSPYVFPGRSGGHLYDLKKPWERIRAAAKLDDVRLHDLRRTVGSWLATSGESLPTIGRVLNHGNASTTQVYARIGEDATRRALDRHGERIMGVARRTAEPTLAAAVDQQAHSTQRPQDPRAALLDRLQALPPEQAAALLAALGGSVAPAAQPAGRPTTRADRVPKKPTTSRPRGGRSHNRTAQP